MMTFVSCSGHRERIAGDPLQSGTYGDIYNFPVKEYEKVLEMEEMQAASEEEDNGEEVCNNFLFYDLLDDVTVIS